MAKEIYRLHALLVDFVVYTHRAALGSTSCAIAAFHSLPCNRIIRCNANKACLKTRTSEYSPELLPLGASHRPTKRKTCYMLARLFLPVIGDAAASAAGFKAARRLGGVRL
eukprot:6205739-Pleurochrysis_carterae.AAC.2